MSCPMSRTRKKQIPLSKRLPVHPKMKELENINMIQILAENSSIYDLIHQDLGIAARAAGAMGMSAERVDHLKISDCPHKATPVFF